MSIGVYQPLADYLSRKQSNVWEATFSEVEKALGRALPRSAYRHQAWWANQNGAGRSQTQGWRSVGWRTSRLDLERQRVCFERDREALLSAKQPAASDEALWQQARTLTGIEDKIALTREALRALIGREAGRYLISAGGTMPDYLVPTRERPKA